MEFFPLLELLEEIQAVVVERTARNSIQDLFGLKASSRSMKALAERRGVYHFLDVLSVPCGLNIGYAARSFKDEYDSDPMDTTSWLHHQTLFWHFQMAPENFDANNKVPCVEELIALAIYALQISSNVGPLPSDTFSFTQNVCRPCMNPSFCKNRRDDQGEIS
ncbi:unnamed protein product [Brassica rapa]|uniref:Uncharacterized protein n=1 Tax=Brassica campestris TaxID=3711 RepID=A0A8D9CWG8_BRACM|nr:unnamed protein product [Brassica rapa]